MKVAFAIDGSTHSIDALRWGIKAFLPRGTSNEIILLSCGAVPSDMFGLDITSLEPFDAASIMQDERIIEEARNKARQVLTQTALPVLKEELADLGLQDIQYELAPITSSDPKDALVQYCEDNHVDLLVVGSRGLSGLKRILVGSVAEYCMRNCKTAAVAIYH